MIQTKAFRNGLKVQYYYYLCILNHGPVVQLVRMPPCHGGGRGFETRPDRRKP